MLKPLFICTQVTNFLKTNKMFKNAEDLRNHLPRSAITRMAKKHGLSRASIYNVMNGKLDNQEILNEILMIAIKEKKRIKEQAKFRALNKELYQGT